MQVKIKFHRVYTVISELDNKVVSNTFPKYTMALKNCFDLIDLGLHNHIELIREENETYQRLYKFIKDRPNFNTYILEVNRCKNT